MAEQSNWRKKISKENVRRSKIRKRPQNHQGYTSKKSKQPVISQAPRMHQYTGYEQTNKISGYTKKRKEPIIQTYINDFHQLMYDFLAAVTKTEPVPMQLCKSRLLIFYKTSSELYKGDV
jgi:hypothetical protein